MSAGRYVSTGFGPVSSAVGMFDPVTMTRSTSARCACCSLAPAQSLERKLLEPIDRLTATAAAKTFVSGLIHGCFSSQSLLEAGIAAQRVPEWIDPKKSRRDTR